MASPLGTIESGIESRLNRARVLRHLYEGTPDDSAADHLGISLDEYRALRSEIIADEGRRVVKMKPEEVFAEYLIEMRRIMRDLMRVRRASLREGVFGPAVQALKTAADILDKSIARGMELGVIGSAAKPTKHLHAHIISHLDNPTLREMIIREVDSMGRLLGSAPESDILDLEPDEVIPADVFEVDKSTKVVEEGEGKKRGARGNPDEMGRPAFAKGGPKKAAGGRAAHRKSTNDIDEILGRD
jgi:hypothetical protein